MDVLAAVRGFVAVSRRRSFSAAATSEGTSQPVMSRRIAALEERLGGALFDRTSRQIVLTPLGSSVLGHAQAMLSAESAFWEAAAVSRTSVVRISVPADHAASGWAEVSVRAQAAGHHLHVDEAPRETRAQALSDGLVEAALLAVDSARAEWSVELGLAAQTADDVAVRLLRPIRARPTERTAVLLLDEDATPAALATVRTTLVGLGLAADQVSTATSTVSALAEVLTGDARLVCSQDQARRWGLGWSPAPELGLRRHYRLQTGRPQLATTLSALLAASIGRALGAAASREAS